MTPATQAKLLRALQDQRFERLGGDWNAATGHEHTEYWYSGIVHAADEVAALFADFLESPRLNDIEIEQLFLAGNAGAQSSSDNCSDAVM